MRSDKITRRIFDCFTFFNELDLLEVRLETLCSVVDVFVIAESPVTYSGQSKPYYFLENQNRFKKFLPKIRHLKVEDMPAGLGFDENWARETHQRSALMRGITDAENSDLVMMSDLDEIPRPEKILQAAKMSCGLRIFKMRFFAYFSNCELFPGNYFWMATGMAEYGLAKAKGFEFILRKIPTQMRLAPDASLRKRVSVALKRFSILIRKGISIHFIEEGGHHFSWLGGVDAVLTKRRAISVHSGEVFAEDYLTTEGAEGSILAAFSNSREIDDTMPVILKEPRFSHLLSDPLNW